MLSIIFIISLLFIYLSIYFWPLYFSRNVTFTEALSYTKYLSKKNRLRLIIPLIIGNIFFILLGIPFHFVNMLPLGIFKYPLMILELLFAMFSSFYLTTLYLSVYINVEYMDLKKIKESNENSNDIENN